MVILKPIEDKRQYNDALARAYELMQSDVIEKSAEANELEVLSKLVEEYELIHYPIRV